MRILLTADLHYKHGWFRWLESEAGKYELICIAGDLLNQFSKVAIEVQLMDAKEFMRRLSAKTLVAVCSGNHDQITILPPLLPDAKSIRGASWLEEVIDVPRLITDGQTRLIGSRLIVTTMPFSSSVELDRKLLEEGKRLKADYVVPWLLVSHDAARVQRVVSSTGPDFVHFGHYHGPDGFSRRSGNTLFLSAGQRLRAAIPNHILLDSETGLAVWKCKEECASSEQAEAF